MAINVQNLKMFRNKTLKRVAIFSILLTFLSAFLVLRWYNSALDFNLVRILRGKPTMTVAVVICDTRLPQALTMMTSLVMFSRNVDLDLRIFQNNISQTELLARLALLEMAHSKQNAKFAFQIYNVSFPEPSWRSLFRPCATQRLFIPKMLPEVDNILYLDTDVIFLSSAYELWKQFLLMNGTQIAGMAPDYLPPVKGGYDSSQIPYYGPRGLNSGVLLMNLTGMRRMDFTNEMRLIYAGYKNKIKLADQDLLNIYFHFHPQWLYVLPCEFNYGTHFCHCYFDKPGTCSCRNAESSGIAVLHGSGKQFHSNQNKFFEQIYDTFAKFDHSKQQLSDVLELLKLRHKNIKGRCSQLNLTVFKKFEKYVHELDP